MSNVNFSESARDDLQQTSSRVHARDYAATAPSECRYAMECEIARQSAQRGDTTPRVCLCHPWEAPRAQA